MKGFLTALFVVLLAGCSFHTSEPPPKIEYITHRVAYSGETLGIISGWYTGSTNNWKEIMSHNPNVDILRLSIGTQILIPKSMVKTEKPITKQYLSKFYRKVEPAKPKEEPKQVQEQPKDKQLEEHKDLEPVKTPEPTPPTVAPTATKTVRIEGKDSLLLDLMRE